MICGQNLIRKRQEILGVMQKNDPKSRIDYIFINNNSFYYIPKDFKVGKIPGTHSNGTRMTDHRFLKLYYDIDKTKKEPGYWKLNVSYLENNNYKKGISDIVHNIDPSLSLLTTWELIKRNVREFSIKFAKTEQKSFEQKIKTIEHEIGELEKEHADSFNYKKIKTLEVELDSLYHKKAKGAQIRSKIKWIEEGEKNSKYCLGLEKHNQASNVIKEIKSEEGLKINKTNAILGEMLMFYQNLYTSKNIPIENSNTYLLEISENPPLNNDDRNCLDNFPSYEECREAVNNMKKEKSPGLDGLPCEFYQGFWDVIGPFFYKALNEIFQRGEMAYSQRISVISLIYKKGEKDSLKNYRPISLTDTDYKIIAFTFAKRLQTILTELISEQQTASIKGRYIGENARLILDVFEYCETENLDGILLFLDFEKAFDSVEWNFLFKVLEKFNITTTS